MEIFFSEGFSHGSSPSRMDLNVVRFCFQVRLETPKGKVYPTPVVSEPVYDKKSSMDLQITKISHCSASCVGGEKIILLCEKVICFYCFILKDPLK
jgi:hypothetical protein